METRIYYVFTCILFNGASSVRLYGVELKDNMWNGTFERLQNEVFLWRDSGKLREPQNTRDLPNTSHESLPLTMTFGRNIHRPRLYFDVKDVYIVSFKILHTILFPAG
jgi:hypothetical protein